MISIKHGLYFCDEHHILGNGNFLAAAVPSGHPQSDLAHVGSAPARERQKSGHMESAKLCCRSHFAAGLKLQDCSGGQQCATPKEFSLLRQSLVRIPPLWLLTKKKSIRCFKRAMRRPEEVRQRNPRISVLRQPNPTHQQRPIPLLRRVNAVNNCQAAALHFQATKTLQSLTSSGISNSTDSDQRLSRSRSPIGQIVTISCAFGGMWCCREVPQECASRITSGCFAGTTGCRYRQWPFRSP